MLCDAADAFGHVNIAALDRREVDIEPLQAELLERMLVQEQAGFLEDLLADLGDGATALCCCDEEVWPDEAEFLVIDAREHLSADDTPLLRAVERLQVNLYRMVLNGAVDGLTDFYLEAGLLEERLLHDDDIVLLLGALQGHGCVVEELLDFFLLQMAAEHGIAGRQVEMGMRVDPRRLHARLDLVMDPGKVVLLRRDQEEAPGSRVDDLAVRKGRLEVMDDGAQALCHLLLSIEGIALGIVVEADGHSKETAPLVDLPQIGRGRRIVQGACLAVDEDVGILEGEVLDEDGQHVEGIHDEVRRGMHAHDVADHKHGPGPDERGLLDRIPGEAPQADVREEHHEQQVEVGVGVDDAVEQAAVVALRIDGEDEPRQR